MNLPSSHSIRSRTIYVSNGVFYALKAISDVNPAWESADAVADAMLAERLASDPINALRVKLFAKKMSDLQAELNAAFPPAKMTGA